MLKEILVRDERNSLPPLDGLRALSILFVIAFHAFFLLQYGFADMAQFVAFAEDMPFWLSWIKRGDLGVDIFFVLSAFLIGSHLFAERERRGGIDLRRFYKKRLLRIYPLYLFALTLSTISNGWDWHLLGNVLAFNNLYDLEDIIIPWSWSLSLELQFYAVAPLLVLWANSLRRLLLATLAAVVISVAWNGWFYIGNATIINTSLLDIMVGGDKEAMLYYLQFLYVVPPARMSAFLFGLAAAWLWTHHRPALAAHRLAHPAIWLAAAVGAGGLALLVAYGDVYLPTEAYSDLGKQLTGLSAIAGRAAFSLGVTTLLMISLLGMEHSSPLSCFLSHRGWYPIARVSYSMYLFHPFMLFLGFFGMFGEEKIHSLSMGQWFALFALGSVFSLVLGVITWYAIERWFIVKRRPKVVVAGAAG